jgi:hypothetical protein
MGLLEPTALALAEALPPSAQIVVVCGRNAALASRLAARQWPCRLVAKGFVSNIDEWMGASDVVITKAGPGTIAEALIRGVPLLLNGAIPCQEEGNVPFVVEVSPACAPCTLVCLLTRAIPASHRTGWASSTQSPRRLRRRWRPGSAPPRTSWRRWRPRLRRWAAQTQPSASCATWRTCAQCTPGRSRPDGGCVAGLRAAACEMLNLSATKAYAMYSERERVTSLAACAAAAPPPREQPPPGALRLAVAPARPLRRTWRLAAPSCASAPPPQARLPARCACTRPRLSQQRRPGESRVAAPWPRAERAWPGTPSAAPCTLATRRGEARQRRVGARDGAERARYCSEDG